MKPGAYESLEVTKAVFREQFGRDPRPTERLKLKTAQKGVLSLTDPRDYCRLWQNQVGDPIANRSLQAEEWDALTVNASRWGCI